MILRAKYIFRYRHCTCRCGSSVGYSGGHMSCSIRSFCDHAGVKPTINIHDTSSSVIIREGFLRKNIVAVSFFLKLCHTPIFLIHVHIFSIK